jgi:hypothetical protein
MSTADLINAIWILMRRGIDPKLISVMTVDQIRGLVGIIGTK